MLFLMMGILRPDVQMIPQELQQLTNDFIGQPLVRIRTAGALRGPDGQRIGMMMIADLESHAAAEQFMRDSPFLGADLYKEVKVLAYTPEVGT